MSPDGYRRNAAECLRIADEVTNIQSKMLLIDMAQSWRLLAKQAEKNRATDLVYETPQRRASAPAVMQQQQQIQPNDEKE